MDTPERNRIAAPIAAEFEDSPFSNYINNLSPIKPVRSVHVLQVFQSLNFTSPPSVFTSPHVSLQKEAKLLRRYQFSDLPKLEFSSVDGQDDKTFVGPSDALQLASCSIEVSQKVVHYDVVPADVQGKHDDGSSSSHSSHIPSKYVVEHLTDSVKADLEDSSNGPPTKLPHNLQYDFSSPKRNVMPCFDTKADPEMVMACTPASIVQYMGVGRLKNQDYLTERQSLLETSQLDSEVGLGVDCQIEQTDDEAPECEWVSLITDGCDDILICNSSAEPEGQGACDRPSEDQNFSTFASVPPDRHDNINEEKEKQAVGTLGFCPQNVRQEPAFQPGEAGEQCNINHTPHLLPDALHNMQTISNPCEKTIDKSICHADHCITTSNKGESQQQRGMRRRCLVFEVAGVHKKIMGDDSNLNTLISSETEGKFSSNDKQLVPVKSRIGPHHMISNIGLHLNSLATHSKDSIMVKQETLASGRRLISMTSSAAPFHSLKDGQKPLNNSLVLNTIKQDLDPARNDTCNTQNAPQGSAFPSSEQSHKPSPKKKKRRLASVGESEGCKRCNCKKSKCLKLYCECFAAGVYCVESCSCQECFNKPMHEDTVLATRKQIESRNPLAFAPKVVRSAESLPDTGEETNKTPASARHKRGCNCKKSSCHKKYCECFQGGVGCSNNCRCEGCMNVFGRKDGTVQIDSEEGEQEEEELGGCDKAGLNENLVITETDKDEQHCTENKMPSFEICRSSVKVPFFSNAKPPRSILAPCKTLSKSVLSQSQPKFEKHFQIIPDDDTPEILRANCMPINGVKVSSPNRKRVSPPHIDPGLSPGRKNVRKLLLQSIPSLPPLTPHCQGKNFSMKFT